MGDVRVSRVGNEIEVSVVDVSEEGRRIRLAVKGVTPDEAGVRRTDREFRGTSRSASKRDRGNGAAEDSPPASFGKTWKALGQRACFPPVSILSIPLGTATELIRSSLTNWVPVATGTTG